MRLTAILLLTATLHVSANSYSQNVTISSRKISLEKVFKSIEEQTNFSFLWNESVLDKTRTISIEVKDAPLTSVLDICLRGLPLSYKIRDKVVLIELTPVLNAVDSARLAPPPPVEIRGTVSDEKGSPLTGVSVVVKGRGKGTSSDENGVFVLTAETGQTLEFSIIGYKSYSVKIGSSHSLAIQLSPMVADLGDLVVLGYGTRQKTLVTGSVVTLSVTGDQKNTPTTSAGNLLAGRIAGVNVATSDGKPGDQPGISIRTQSSWNSQDVLYVIDGKISGSGDFNNLSPNEIDNFTVLKDAAAAAVYGSRAAGGVILVTTKRGYRTGKPVIEYSFNTGFDTRTKNAPLTSAVQAGELYNRINTTSDPAGWAWTQGDLDYFKKINNGWGYSQLDAVWQKPYVTTHNLSASGGSEKIKYFIGGSYVKQGGFVQNLSYDKYNIRANITADLTKNFQLFAGLALNNNLTSTNTWEGPDALYRKLLVWQPDQPVFTNTNKPIDYGWIANVGATVRGDGGYIKTNYLKPQINLSATYKIPFIPGLSAQAIFNKSYADNRTKYFQKNYTMYVMKKTGNHIIGTNDADIVNTKLSSNISKDYLQENATWSQDYQLNFQVNYERTFGNLHHVQAWLVYEKQQAQGSGMSAGVETFPVYTTDQWWATSSQRINSYVSNGQTYSDWTTGRKSYIGQFYYDYAGKYLASFSYREDGSMNFAPGKRWGFFPAGSVGWILSKENFFSKIRSIDFLKIRASAGLTGNDAVGGWQWQQAYVQGNSAYFGTSPSTSSGLTYGSVVNPNLTWEKSLNYNVGLDMNFLGHWNTSLEYYRTKTYDILGARLQSVPPTFSLTLPSENYGKVQAQGFDISLGYRNKKGAFSYYANVTASYGWNKYLRYDDSKTSKDYQIKTGKSLSYISGLFADGIISNQGQLDKFNAARPGYSYFGVAPALGQLVYKDVSGPNKTADGTIDNWDYSVIRKNNDPIVYGINLGGEWKGFSLDVLFNGNLRQWKSVEGLAEGVEWNRMWSKWYTDSWTPANTGASLPQRLSAVQQWNGNTTYTNSATNFWYKNAGFMRLKYLNVGYTLPLKWYARAGIGGIKLYFSGTNLFIVSKFNRNYYDPEMSDGMSVPPMRTFNFGANIKF